ncbi:acrylyl-CoA reductase (NADPH) [Congregibacter litoralis]|uniref:Putative quinone oxidoreductase, YhdH/YhfP family n=1 Tax=Congregibacter litoralis KT71 TaxID=314285 RepID=A4AE07_9GAMM|nr:MDR family oxidoreductase [Congregibacter litoralis]EAQ95755.1 putative quinone oxidoreductase, YhdH/YhfP family [Congregibacter litoralis KT71]
MSDSFNALVARKDDSYACAYETLTLDDLDAGDVTVAVEYSTLNFKDGLAISGAAPIAQRHPLVLGIDYAGTVLESTHAGFTAGDRVVMNGYGASEYLHGGYAERARVSGDLLVKVPESISNAQAMAIGTAGYTAMLSVMALQKNGPAPGDGPILVTGAAGGVGTVAISLLADLGYEVIGSTGRAQESEFLLGLGATGILDRAELSDKGKPLQKERWAGVIDCVGSHTLANAIAQTRYDGVVTACGLAQGADLPSTVMPFILRNVRLQGVDSVQAPMSRRLTAWDRLAKELDLSKLEALSFDLPFSEVLSRAPEILAGNIRGRAVVDLSH